MHKVYNLLRNNKQNGPYDLEELLQFNLKPDDLIWIEGKSAGWYYPQEIEALKPHLQAAKFNASAPAPVQPATPVEHPASAPATVLSEGRPVAASASKKVFVSMPVRPTEGPRPMHSAPRVEAPVESAPRHTEPVAPATQPVSSPVDEALHTGYSRTLEEVESEYTSWMYKNKAKKKGITVSKKAAAVALLAAVAGFAAWQGLKNDESSEPPVAQTTPVSQPEAAQPENVALNSETIPDRPANVPEETAPNPTENSKPELTPQTPTAENSQPQETTPVSQSIPDETPVVNKEAEPQPAVPEPAVVTETPKEEKKKLKEKLGDLFKKKKDESAKSEPRSTEEEAGERRAARREADLSTQVTVRFEVPNEWMLGIKGAKAAVTNQSTQTLTKALIEVTYYSADGDALQTKSFSVGNLASKKTVSVSIPDHATAERVDYRIVSAAGAEALAAR